MINSSSPAHPSYRSILPPHNPKFYRSEWCSTKHFQTEVHLPKRLSFANIGHGLLTKLAKEIWDAVTGKVSPDTGFTGQQCNKCIHFPKSFFKLPAQDHEIFSCQWTILDVKTSMSFKHSISMREQFSFSRDAQASNAILFKCLQWS